MPSRAFLRVFTIVQCGLGSIVHPQGLSLTENSLDVLRQHPISLDTVDHTPPRDDLTFLTAFVSDARVVALGEATHGNLEFTQMKHRIIQYLVTEMGFGVVAFETDMSAAGQIDAYTRGHGGDSDASFLHPASIWYTHEIRELLAWMRRHSISAPGTVRFACFDMGAPIVEILDLLDQVDQDYSAQAANHHEVVFGTATAENLESNYRQNVPAWRSGASAVHEHMLANADRNRSSAPPCEVAIAIQNARLVLPHHTYYEHTRDEFMAQNVQWLLEQHPNEKLIPWAHNGHVAEAELDDWSDSERMGWHLANAQGDDYVSVGMVTGHGAHRPFGRNGVVISELPPIEHGGAGQLGRLEEPLFFLPLRGLQGIQELHSLDGSVAYARNIGNIVARSGLRPIPLSDAYDGIIYTDEVSPSNRVP